jgi:hypothetical protein
MEMKSRAPAGEEVPGFLLDCPLSGLALHGLKFRPHKIAVKRCGRGGGQLTAWCRLHRCRIFVNHRMVVLKILEEYMGVTDDEKARIMGVTDGEVEIQPVQPARR